MHVLEEWGLCSGCHACYSICPKRCITMQEDEEGFLQPSIDETKCIDCGLCRRVCPVINKDKCGSEGQAYACINNNEAERMQSSSGGVFVLLAKAVLQNNGIVFGAAFDEQLVVRHIGVEKTEMLVKLQGSKYVQSCVGDTYIQAKTALDNGRQVLYSGTPCQIDGLLNYLQKPYDNLYAVDMVCHGTPSPKCFEKYLQYREELSKSKVHNVFFRSKSTGWARFSVRMDFENGESYEKNHPDDLYMKAFLKNHSLRRSCYACASKTLNRRSDITLADFWGIEQECPQLYDDKGTSLILVNSARGRELFNQVKEKMKTVSVDIDVVSRYNMPAVKSVSKPKNRERFLKMLEKTSFEYAVKRCVQKSSIRKNLGKVKRWIKRMCKKNV